METFLSYLKKYILITIGCALYALSVSQFIQPANLVSGGVTGVAIIINKLTSISTGLIILIINVPIIALGIWKFGIKFSVSSIFAVTVSSVLIDVFAPFGALTHDKLIAAVCGGVLCGASLGMVFRVGATTGGTDIIAKLIRLKWRHIKSGVIILSINAAIVLIAGLLLNSLDLAVYATIGLVIQSWVMNTILYGSDSARLIFIISDKPDDIAAALLKNLSIGVTYLSGEGAYTHLNKHVLMSAVHPKTAPKVRSIVRSVDEHAFMIVTSATEVLGNGFKRIDSEDL